MITGLLSGFFYHWDPDLVLGIFRVGVQVDLYIRRTAVFVAGCREPLHDNAPFQILEGAVCPRAGKDRPGGGGHRIFLKRARILAAGNGDEIPPVLAVLACADTQQAPRLAVHQRRQAGDRAI